MLVKASHCCAVKPYAPASRLPTCPHTFASRNAQRTRSRAGICPFERTIVIFQFYRYSILFTISPFFVKPRKGAANSLPHVKTEHCFSSGCKIFLAWYTHAVNENQKIRMV